MKIPFNHIALTGDELEYISRSIERGHISGDGYFNKKCQAFLEKYYRPSKVLLTTSCTHALEISAILFDIKPGDEVIVPSFTFVSTINAFVLHGAKPVCIDIRRDTLNMDETLLEDAISERTKTIVPVHYAGVGCEMDAIMALSKKYNIKVVEDNAHGIFAKYKGKLLGSFGDLGALSFHESKNIICGEGGALIINNIGLFERAEIVREKGTNRSKYLRHEIDKYSWIDKGSSYVMSDILAAFLFAQLEKKYLILKRRKIIWDYYYKALSAWAANNGIGLPVIPGYCQQSYAMFYLIMPSMSVRGKFIEYLRVKGIQVVSHYLPLHLSAMGKKYGGKKNQCPVAEDLSSRIVRLPFYNSIKKSELLKICEIIERFEP